MSISISIYIIIYIYMYMYKFIVMMFFCNQPAAYLLRIFTHKRADFSVLFQIAKRLTTQNGWKICDVEDGIKAKAMTSNLPLLHGLRNHRNPKKLDQRSSSLAVVPFKENFFQVERMKNQTETAHLGCQEALLPCPKLTRR